MLPAAECLKTASDLVAGPRNETHGRDIYRNMKTIGDSWTWWLRARGLLKDGAEIAPSDVAEMQSLLKKSRKANGMPVDDHYVDDAAYVAIASQVRDEKPAMAKAAADGRYWYVASAYTKFHGGLDNAFRLIANEMAILVEAGIPAFSPICHSHPIAMYGGIDPRSHDVWLRADEPLMLAAKGLIICKLPGWDESYGIGQEIKAFTNARKPIVYMEPGVVPSLPA